MQIFSSVYCINRRKKNNNICISKFLFKQKKTDADFSANIKNIKELNCIETIFFFYKYKRNTRSWIYVHLCICKYVIIKHKFFYIKRRCAHLCNPYYFMYGAFNDAVVYEKKGGRSILRWRYFKIDRNFFLVLNKA